MAEVEELTPEQIAALEAEIATLQTKINEQGDSIKELKKNNADRATVMEAVNQLNGLKAEKTKLSNRLFPPKVLEMNREEMADALTRRFFLCPAFSIYGGFKGLFDLGPPGCAIKANLLNYWRQFFVLEDNMLEVDTTSLTPDIVLRVSGHEAKFKDLMVKDVVTGTCHRADHLLEDHLDTLLKNPGLSEELANEYRTVAGLADDYSPEELHEKLTKYNIKAPDTGNDITAPFPFNLMFQTQIGPTGDSFGYMRPETAQGIFVNFPRLLEFNGGKLPFAGACIGTAFRNEISPRNGLLRVREFQLAEIEHFMLPNETDHPKYDTVTEVVLSLYSRGQQKTGTGRTLRRTVAQAVAEGLILNQTHAYYIARVQQFLLDIGIRRTGLRFRQHLENEKAHYASDCWDAEILTSYGWIECVGIADRSDFDLTQHSNHTGARMSVHVPFADGPRLVDALEVKPDKKTIGQKYGKKANHLFEFLAGLSTDEAKSLQEKLAAGPADVTVKYVEKPDKKAGPHAVGQECVETFTLEAGMVTFSPIKKKETGSNVLPVVIEPSFGVGRILYSLLEHAYQVRPDDAQKKYFSLSPVVAPLKCVILPLLSTDELKAPAQRIARLLAHNNVSYKIDDVGKSIGRRYARADELGIPFGVTIDHTTLQNDTVTVRERDTTLQVRIKIDELAPLLSDIIQGRTTWADVRAQPEKYPHVDPVADEEEGSSSKA